MKRILVALTSLMFVGVLAHGADAEKEASSSVDTSKNPITGTVTTKKKSKKKSHDAHGEKTAEVTETTKEKKDGSVSKSVEVNQESEVKK